MATESGQKAQQNWLSEGLVLALLSVMSYAIAFTYEAGYFEHFDLPLSLIEINISVTVVAFFSLLVTLLLFYVIAEMVNPFWGKIPQPLRSRFFFYIYFLFIIVTNLVVAKGKPDGIRFIFYFLAVMAFFDFIVPAIPRKDGKRYLERLAEIHKRELAYDSVMDKLAYKLGFGWFRLLALAVVLLYLSYSTGLGKARLQTDYFSLEGRANSVILKLLENKLIWTTYHPKSNEVAPSFTIENLADGTKYVMKKVKIGPLSRPTPPEHQDQKNSNLTQPSSEKRKRCQEPFLTSKLWMADPSLRASCPLATLVHPCTSRQVTFLCAVQERTNVAGTMKRKT